MFLSDNLKCSIYSSFTGLCKEFECNNKLCQLLLEMCSNAFIHFQTHRNFTVILEKYIWLQLIDLASLSVIQSFFRKNFR